MRSQLCRLEKLDLGRVRRRTSRKARSITLAVRTLSSALAGRRKSSRRQARRHWLAESSPGASSRTTVTKFSAMRRYRFFFRVARESGNAPASLTLRLAEEAAVEIAAIGDCAVGSVLGLAGRHAGPAAIDASRGLLLPLLASEEPGKLREDVRAAEIRFALVGDVLREVAKPFQRRQSRSRAALAA